MLISYMNIFKCLTITPFYICKGNLQRLASYLSSYRILECNIIRLLIISYQYSWQHAHSLIMLWCSVSERNTTYAIPFPCFWNSIHFMTDWHPVYANPHQLSQVQITPSWCTGVAPRNSSRRSGSKRAETTCSPSRRSNQVRVHQRELMLPNCVHRKVFVCGWSYLYILSPFLLISWNK